MAIDLGTSYLGGIRKPVPAQIGFPVAVDETGFNVTYANFVRRPAKDYANNDLGFDSFSLGPLIRRLRTQDAATPAGTFSVNMSEFPQSVVTVGFQGIVRTPTGAPSFFWRRRTFKYEDNVLSALAAEDSTIPDVDTGAWLAGGATTAYVIAGSNLTLAVQGIAATDLRWSTMIGVSILTYPTTDAVV